ncbi:hypothetical protein nbrc107696_44070 [Gordonia spumicola]|uniref:Uncharacterized protein n=1 Tax=Gordonia spumicola TaxID=589161 RepID=A0A7I9VFU4_9ACTN|nr:hypothetical protein [Gordonia spumicola]GEE03961.1 hypothetical protein nbrc107696_44070 [Gordonia spumicola]
MGKSIAPERRTRVDLIVTAAIVVAVVVAGLVVWATSDARQAHLETAPAAPSTPAAAEESPQTLRVAWTAPSSATRIPQLTAASVITADGGSVTAHDPATGSVRWRYTRDDELCGALAAWPGGADRVLAVYRNSRGCSEVTALRGDTGLRAGARTSDADTSVALSYDGDYALSVGDTRLETWGTNMVRGIEYGRIDAPVNPDKTPGRTNCRIFSALPGGSRVALVERCDGDLGYRLTVIGAAQSSDEKIIQWGTTMLTRTSHGPAPQIIANTSQAVAVYDGGVDETGETGRIPGPRIRVYTPQAEPVSTHPVSGDAALPTSTAPVTDSGVITAWTGTGTVVIDGTTAVPMYQVPGAIGPGSVMAGELLLPMHGAISVRQLSDGHEVRSIPVDRAGYDADAARPVALRVLGPWVVEQRGATVVALSS